MASGGVIALEFIINLSRCVQIFLQIVGADERGGAVHFIKVLDLFRDVNVTCRIVQFLMCQFFTEYGIEFLLGDWSACARV